MISIFLLFVKPWPVVSCSDHWFQLVLCRDKCAVGLWQKPKIDKLVNFIVYKLLAVTDYPLCSLFL